MKKSIEKLEKIKLVGITVRTSNASEMNPMTAKIGLTMERFFGEGLQNKIANRKKPGTVFAVYTDYESDEHGAYSYFLGEEVHSFDKVEPELQMLTISPQTYVKLTAGSGKMPDVVVDMWKNIWKMNAADLGGQRAYQADFEVYDERSQDPNNAILDIYVGLKD